MGTTNTLDLNNRVTKLEKAVSGGDSAQANKKDIATEFNATTAYTAGCFVYYQGKLYQFNTDHAAGAWDSTDVVEANVTDQIVSNKAAIDGLTASDIMMSDGVTSVEDALENVFPVGKNRITLPYTAQKDGILVVRAHPSTTAGGIYGVYVTMSNSEVDAFIVTCATGNDNTASFPVAKGTILTEYGAISTISAALSYYPMF